MRLKPNDAPVMELNEVRRFTVNLTGAAGVNTVSSCSATSDSLTVGTATASGLNVSFTVTASETGTHVIIVQAVLSSSETVRGALRVKVVDSTVSEGSSDYGRC